MAISISKGWPLGQLWAARNAVVKKIQFSMICSNSLGSSIAQGEVGMTHQKRKNENSPASHCEEKYRLIEEFLASNHVLMNLQNEQVQSVIDQDPEFARFDDLIHMARETKDRAKYALMAHVEEHHC